MAPYNNDFSHAHTALSLTSTGLYESETILHAFDATCYEGFANRNLEEKVLIITDERVLFVKNLTKLLVMASLSNISTVTTEGNQIVLNMSNG